MGVFESIKYGFVGYKEKIGDGLLCSIALVLAGLLFFIPFIGPVIFSYVYIKLLRKIAEIWELTRGKMDDKEAFKAALIILGVPGILFWVLLIDIIFSLFHYISTGEEQIILMILPKLFVVIAVAFILQLLFYGPFINLVVGKASKLYCSVGESLRMIIVNFLAALLIGFVIGIIAAIIHLINPVAASIFKLVEIFVSVIPVLATIHYAANQ